jgi:nucleotide-binding universal stress UspA family protein
MFSGISSMKILLAIDGSPHSNEAVDEVARRSWPKGSYVHVLNVLQLPPLGLMGVPVTYVDELIRPATAHAQNIVNVATEKLRRSCGSSVNVYGFVHRGSPKWAILEEANRMDADLIVIGAHGDGFMEGFLMGSITHAVVLHARCSVEIVRSRPLM